MSGAGRVCDRSRRAAGGWVLSWTGGAPAVCELKRMPVSTFAPLGVFNVLCFLTLKHVSIFAKALKYSWVIFLFPLSHAIEPRF